MLNKVPVVAAVVAVEVLVIHQLNQHNKIRLQLIIQENPYCSTTNKMNLVLRNKRNPTCHPDSRSKHIIMTHVCLWYQAIYNLTICWPEYESNLIQLNHFDYNTRTRRMNWCSWLTKMTLPWLAILPDYAAAITNHYQAHWRNWNYGALHNHLIITYLAHTHTHLHKYTFTSVTFFAFQ